MADVNNDVNNQSTDEQTQSQNQNTGDDKNNQSVEQMLAEVMAENKRLKKAVDKASSEAANYKKQFMSTKSEADKAAIEKAEKDASMKAELEELRKESKINQFRANFIASGYSDDLAQKAAEAMYENDTDALFQLQKQYLSEHDKAVKAKLMKDMPAPAIGNDDSVSMTKEEFAKLGYMDRLKLKQEHPTVYHQLAK